MLRPQSPRRCAARRSGRSSRVHEGELGEIHPDGAAAGRQTFERVCQRRSAGNVSSPRELNQRRWLNVDREDGLAVNSASGDIVGHRGPPLQHSAELRHRGPE